MAKKEFNLRLYGIIAIIVVVAVVSILTVFTFTTRYTAFDAEKMAVAYVDTIVENGDGYNAFKDTLLSKDQKFGDYIRQNYIYPVVYEGYTAGGSTDDLEGLDNEDLMNENSQNDDGSLEGQVIDTMYPYFVELIETNNGFDNYDVIFTSYIAKLREVRAQIFGDTYFDDDIFFDAFESNLSSYGESLTGTEDEYDSNTGVQTKFASVGAYQEKYGEDYTITVTSDGYKEQTGDTAVVNVNVTVNGETVVADFPVSLVKAGHSWYVDNTACDTGILYSFYK